MTQVTKRRLFPWWWGLKDNHKWGCNPNHMQAEREMRGHLWLEDLFSMGVKLVGKRGAEGCERGWVRCHLRPCNEHWMGGRAPAKSKNSKPKATVV